MKIKGGSASEAAGTTTSKAPAGNTGTGSSMPVTHVAPVAKGEASTVSGSDKGAATGRSAL